MKKNKEILQEYGQNKYWNLSKEGEKVKSEYRRDQHYQSY